MSCLTNVTLLQEVLGLDTYQDKWIQTAQLAASPMGDFVVVASGKVVVMYVKTGSKQTFQILRTHGSSSKGQNSHEEDNEDDGEITAVAYFPVKVVGGGGGGSQGRGGRLSEDLWHCVAVGYESGKVEIVADTGQVLVSKQFHTTKVVNIRALKALNNPHDGLACTLSVPKLQELVIVYENLLAVVESGALYSALSMFCKRHISQSPNSMT